MAPGGQTQIAKPRRSPPPTRPRKFRQNASVTSTEAPKSLHGVHTLSRCSIHHNDYRHTTVLDTLSLKPRVGRRRLAYHRSSVPPQWVATPDRCGGVLSACGMVTRARRVPKERNLIRCCKSLASIIEYPSVVVILHLSDLHFGGDWTPQAEPTARSYWGTYLNLLRSSRLRGAQRAHLGHTGVGSHRGCTPQFNTLHVFPAP